MLPPQYIAGLIDGEGYFGLIPLRKKASINTSFTCAIKIALTGFGSTEVLTKLRDQYGGYLEVRSTLTSGGKVVTTWTLKSKVTIAKLLIDISPYLIVKSRHAAIMKRYCELPNAHPLYRSADVLIERDSLAHELKSLNVRQRVATTE